MIFDLCKREGDKDFWFFAGEEFKSLREDVEALIFPKFYFKTFKKIIFVF